MKVLHINCNYMDSWLHQTMVETLSKFNVDSEVFVPLYSLEGHIVKPNENVTTSVCFKKKDRIFFDYKQSKIIKSVENCYNILNFDCIHAYTLFTDGNVAMQLSKKYGIPYVVAVRNTDVNAFFRKNIHLRGRGIEIMRNAKAVFFLSESYRKQVFDKYIPIKNREELYKKTYVIPNGINSFWLENIYNERTEVKKNIRILYVGRINENKNIIAIQNAIKTLKDQGIYATLTVIGSVEDDNLYKKIVENEDTIVLPPLPKEQLIYEYRNNEIFAMVSFKETFGLVYAEAMSQGMPVIYTEQQGFDGQFENGVVGYAVNPNDYTEIAEAIKKIAQNYDEISTRCKDLVGKFDWNLIAKAYSEIYDM